MTLPYRNILSALTLLLSVSLAVVSAAGAFFPGTYEIETENIAAQLAGQDVVDLFVGVPLLLLTWSLARRGNRTGMLLYGGVLAYIMYSFVIYAFGLRFNPFFLLYCATLGLSLYAFILWMKGMGRFDWSTWFQGMPVRGVSLFLILVAMIFYGLWLSALLPPILRGTVPEEIRQNDNLINPIHVIDMAFALPALIIAGVLLWKKQSLGYLLAAVSLVFIILLTLALAAMMGMLRFRGISDDASVVLIFGVICLVSVGLVVPMFRRLGRSDL